MILGKREEVNLTLPEIYHEPSLNIIVSGWAALHCRYQKVPLKYDLRGRIRLFISLPLVKIVVRQIKESMRRLVGQTDIKNPKYFGFTALVMQLGYALAPSPSANPLC